MPHCSLCGDEDCSKCDGCGRPECYCECWDDWDEDEDFEGPARYDADELGLDPEQDE